MSENFQVGLTILVLILLPLIMYFFIRFYAFILEFFVKLFQPVKYQYRKGVSNTGSEVDQKTLATIEQKYRTEQQILSSARWFYWIAGLSVVNLIVMHQGIHFVVGLGLTEFMLAFQDSIGIAAVLLDTVVLGIFIMFGYYANKRYNWAFIIGMIVYGLDGLLFILIKDYLSIAFHVFVVVMIYKGYKANKSLPVEQVEVEQVEA